MLPKWAQLMPTALSSPWRVGAPPSGAASAALASPPLAWPHPSSSWQMGIPGQQLNHEGHPPGRAPHATPFHKTAAGRYRGQNSYSALPARWQPGTDPHG